MPWWDEADVIWANSPKCNPELSSTSVGGASRARSTLDAILPKRDVTANEGGDDPESEDACDTADAVDTTNTIDCDGSDVPDQAANAAQGGDDDSVAVSSESEDMVSHCDHTNTRTPLNQSLLAITSKDVQKVRVHS